jgi:endonuclease-3 related protein
VGDQALSEKLLGIYDRLLADYGPQHWWPAREPFEVIVGAILTQSAAWTNVVKAIFNLQAAGALNPAELRRLTQGELAGLIRPSGYYNAKARKLKEFAAWFGGRYDDSLELMFRRDTAGLRRELLSVHGIGEETADSILLYAGSKPIFVIDAYTRRIFSRLGLAPAQDSYGAYQQLFTDNLPADAPLFNEYHALLVCLGKNTCKTRPVCEGCCLGSICTSRL